ncbi:hypothetical protein ACFXOX_23570 [Bacillus subtilis]
MNTVISTNILTAIAVTVLILQAAAQVPLALAELLRSFKQVRTALCELRSHNIDAETGDHGR